MYNLWLVSCSFLPSHFCFFLKHFSSILCILTCVKCFWSFACKGYNISLNYYDTVALNPWHWITYWFKSLFTGRQKSVVGSEDWKLESYATPVFELYTQRVLSWYQCSWPLVWCKALLNHRTSWLTIVYLYVRINKQNVIKTHWFDNKPWTAKFHLLNGKPIFVLTVAEEFP